MQVPEFSRGFRLSSKPKRSGGRYSVAFALVDDPEKRLAREEAAKIFRDLDVVAVPELFGDGGRVRRDQAVFEIPERRIGGERLAGENIERGGGDGAVAQSVGKGGFVHQGTATHVDEAGVALHAAQAFGGNDARRLRCTRGAEDDVIGFGEHAVEVRGTVHRGKSLASLLRMFADGDDTHAEGIRALGGFAADAAEAEQAE